MRRIHGKGLVGLLLIVLAASIIGISNPLKPSLSPRESGLAETEEANRDLPPSPDPEPEEESASDGPLAGKVIALDPGHGGRDRGARGLGGSHEADNTLATAMATKEVLEEAGAQVVLTRTGDYAPGHDFLRDAGHSALLAHRVVIAEQAGADVLISIHNDANYNRAITGTTTYTWRDFDLAESIQTALTERLNSRDIGVRQAPFWVIQRAEIPAVLVELGFISNPEEEKLLRNPDYQRLAAEALRDGLIDYFWG